MIKRKKGRAQIRSREKQCDGWRDMIKVMMMTSDNSCQWHAESIRLLR